MNRKLRNSFSAFSAAGATLAVALVMAMPAGFSPRLGATTSDALGASVLTTEIVVASSLAAKAAAEQDARTDPRVARKGTRHRRQTLVMPYFSFSPRG